MGWVFFPFCSRFKGSTLERTGSLNGSTTGGGGALSQCGGGGIGSPTPTSALDDKMTAAKQHTKGLGSTASAGNNRLRRMRQPLPQRLHRKALDALWIEPRRAGVPRERSLPGSNVFHSGGATVFVWHAFETSPMSRSGEKGVVEPAAAIVAGAAPLKNVD